MNIQQYIHSLTDEEFEQLCTEYLTLHYKNKNITIHGTRLKKDGGKDIVGTAQDVPYEIWAECKRHNRALGLEKISKNVILVISKGINELIYFSTSDITRNAVKHVSIVAAKHNSIIKVDSVSLGYERDRIPMAKNKFSLQINL